MKQRLQVNEESYKAYTKEELSLRKRRKEIHQAPPCWYMRSGKTHGQTFATQHVLDLTTHTDAHDDAWAEEITGWDP